MVITFVASLSRDVKPRPRAGNKKPTIFALTGRVFLKISTGIIAKAIGDLFSGRFTQATRRSSDEVRAAIPRDNKPLRRSVDAPCSIELENSDPTENYHLPFSFEKQSV